MGKIFYIIGKSASGKDSILSRLAKDPEVTAEQIVQTTTRPMRDGEVNGREYHFISEDEMHKLRDAGKIVECRTYHTVYGDWYYMLADDGSIDLDTRDYLAVGTVESYSKVRDYFGDDLLIPVYIDVETGERLYRALMRERTHENPKYTEMCRRFLADEADFDEAHLQAAGLLLPDGGIRNRFENQDFSVCLQEVKQFIMREIRSESGENPRK